MIERLKEGLGTVGTGGLGEAGRVEGCECDRRLSGCIGEENSMNDVWSLSADDVFGARDGIG